MDNDIQKTAKKRPMNEVQKKSFSVTVKIEGYVTLTVEAVDNVDAVKVFYERCGEAGEGDVTWDFVGPDEVEETTNE